MSQQVKIAAPKNAKDKALWDKIEKSVRDYGKYKEGPQLYKVVSDAYQKAGGTYTHESEKAASSTQQLIALGEKLSVKYPVKS